MRLRLVFFALSLSLSSCLLAEEDESEVIIEVVPREPASIRDVKPIYELLAYRPDENTHISELDSNLVVVQLVEFMDEGLARSFVTSHPTLKVIGVRINRDDSEYFLILLGVFDDMDTARWATESFIEENPKFEVEGIRRIVLGELKPSIVKPD